MKRILTAMCLAVLMSLPSATQSYPIEPYPDNVERWKGDGGFSRGFGMTNHAFSFDWFDSHIHLAWSHYPNRLKGPQIQEVMDRWFGMTGVYQSGRAIVLDPYLETMEWAKGDPRVHVFWWLTWDQAGQLPGQAVAQLVVEGLGVLFGVEVVVGFSPVAPATGEAVEDLAGVGFVIDIRRRVKG